MWQKRRQCKEGPPHLDNVLLSPFLSFNATSRSLSSFYKVASSTDLACGLNFAVLKPGFALRKAIMAGNCLPTIVRRPKTGKPNCRCLPSSSHHTLFRLPLHPPTLFSISGFSHSIISSLHSAANRSPIQRAVSHLGAITVCIWAPIMALPGLW